MDNIFFDPQHKLVKAVNKQQGDFESRVERYRREVEASPTARVPPPGNPMPALFYAFWLELLNSDIGGENRDRLNDRDKQIQKWIDKHDKPDEWIEERVPYFRMTATKNKQSVKLCICIRHQDLRAEFLDSLHFLPKKIRPSFKSGPAPTGYIEEECQIWLEALEGRATQAQTASASSGNGNK